VLHKTKEKIKSRFDALSNLEKEKVFRRHDNFNFKEYNKDLQDKTRKYVSISYFFLNNNVMFENKTHIF